MAKEKGERISTGVPGLDKLMEGGFLKNDIYLVTGGTGTGKTLFCSQFIMDGLQKGEKGIFFSLEELPEDIVADSKNFGWDFQKYIDKKMFLIEYQDPFEMVDITTLVRKKVESFGAKRVVIDSTSIFGMVFGEQELRKNLYQLIKTLKKTDTVVLMTAEILQGSQGLSRFGVEEFVVDGIIALYNLRKENVRERSIEILKMRGSKFQEKIVAMQITEEGVVVYPQQQVLGTLPP